MRWTRVSITEMDGFWHAYASDFDLFAVAESKIAVKAEMLRLLDETQGEHTISITFVEC